MKGNDGKGEFIVFEGPDGAGKSKAIEFIKKEFAFMGIPAIFSREPGGTPYAEAVRKELQSKKNSNVSIMADIFGYATCRADHVDKVIKPNIDKGETVICDRYFGSTYAYQIYARGREGYESAFNAITEFAINGCVPDMWILLDVDSLVAAERNKRAGNKNSRFDVESVEFHKRVREGYYKFFDKYAKGKPHRIIDTTELLEHEVGKMVLNAILAFLKNE